MYEEKIRKILERGFDSYHRVAEKLSLKWREHANRRTILILAILGSLLTFLFLTVVRPPDNFPLNELVTIREGATLNEASATLESIGVVRSAAAFRFIVAASGHERDVHAGDYLFKEP